MLLLAIIVFTAGILTFVAPCTLPVLPAYVSFATAQSPVKRIWRTALFGMGLAGVFLAFGLLAGTMGMLLAAYKTNIVLFSGILFIILGIMILLGRGIPGFNIHAKSPSTTAGIIGFGALFGLSWSGCIGPILGAVLILAANTQTAVVGGILLLIYAAGLLTPLAIVSTLLDAAPRNGTIWRILRGRMVTIGAWEVHTTSLVSGGMLIIIGIFFISGAAVWLSSSPMIERLFAFEDKLLSATTGAP